MCDYNEIKPDNCKFHRFFGNKINLVQRNQSFDPFLLACIPFHSININNFCLITWLGALVYTSIIYMRLAHRIQFQITVPITTEHLIILVSFQFTKLNSWGHTTRHEGRLARPNWILSSRNNENKYQFQHFSFILRFCYFYSKLVILLYIFVFGPNKS